MSNLFPTLISVKLILLLTLIVSGCNDNKDLTEVSDDYLEDIFDPVIVGSPPRNAFVGLVKLNNGEIRHYTYEAKNSLDTPHYIRSVDQGRSWDTVFVKSKWIGADKKIPNTDNYIRLASTPEGVYCIKSSGGLDGEWYRELVYTPSEEEGQYIMLKPPVFLKSGRILVGAHSNKRFGCGAFYSDDQGETWQRSQFVQAPPHIPDSIHKSYRWNHGAVEPTLLELEGDRVWMLARTAQDQHYESFSEDGGGTWSELKPSRFYGTITMPTLGRLKDGRILFLWNNTTPLPEKEGNTGVWEDVFTNRDVLHAAISEDEGQSWIGFREVLLNPNRNNSTFAVADQSLSLDMSVHQTQFVELDSGEILVSAGQHRKHRKLIKFNVDWLYEDSRAEDLSEVLKNLTVHQYKKGIVGHCAYNRHVGVDLKEKPSKGILLSHPMDTTLETPVQGLVWNFPSMRKGKFTADITIPKGSRGGRVSLVDRWFNAGDTTSYLFSQYFKTINDLPRDELLTLEFNWNLDLSDKCNLKINGVEKDSLDLNFECKNGLSYIHFQSYAREVDSVGFIIHSMSAQKTN